MLELRYGKKFDKDLKRADKRSKNLNKLWKIVDALLRGEKLPEKNRNHKLSSDYDGVWECHIEPDWLLVYDITETHVVLIRTGSHSDLF